MKVPFCCRGHSRPWARPVGGVGRECSGSPTEGLEAAAAGLPPPVFKQAF